MASVIEGIFFWLLKLDGDVFRMVGPFGQVTSNLTERDGVTVRETKFSSNIMALKRCLDRERKYSIIAIHLFSYSYPTHCIPVSNGTSRELRKEIFFMALREAM